MSTTASKELAATARPPRFRLAPDGAPRVVILVCLVLILLVRVFRDEIAGVFPLFDTAAANLATLVLSFLIVVTLMIWFLCLSSYSWQVRGKVLLALLALATVMLAGFRLDGPTGDMAFGLAPRNWLAHYVSRPRPEPKQAEGGEATADLATTTPDDFPQFLGPQRNNHLPAVELSGNWNTTPPKLLWKQRIGEGWCAFAAVNGYAVTLEQQGQEEWVTCYEISTGNLVWKRATAGRHEAPMGGVGPRATPTIYQGRVYTVGGTGLLQCLDGKRGTVVWDDNLLKRTGTTLEQDRQLVMWGRAGSPLVVPDLGLLVVAGGGTAERPISLVAYDLSTGEPRWTGGTFQISYVSPIEATLAGRRQIISINESNVTGHDIATGKVLWQHSWPGSSSGNANCSQPHVLSGDRVLLSKGYGEGAEMLRIAADGGKLSVDSLWKNQRVLRTKFTNVTIIGEFAYGLSDGVLECVDLADGTSRWKRGRYGHGQILGVGDLILVLAESGRLSLVEANPTKHVELGRIDALDGKTWNPLCLYGKLLLIRNSQEAACYELP